MACRSLDGNLLQPVVCKVISPTTRLISLGVNPEPEALSNALVAATSIALNVILRLPVADAAAAANWLPVYASGPVRL